MDGTDNAQWGFFRRPMLLGPAVGFLAFLGSEAIKSPPSGIGDGLIWLPLILVIATIIAAIPYLLGALALLVAIRVLPKVMVRFAAVRVLLGGMIGTSIAWPFAHVLNWIPSATADPRFSFDSMLVAGAVAGGYCAAFFTEAISGAPSDK